MPSTAVADKPTTSVGMGALAVAKGSERLSSILGSCVGLVLYHPRMKIGGLAHVVLPSAAGRSGTAGKFADLAVPEMIKQLESIGAKRAGLVAKLFGGASMFGGQGPMQIGISNIAAVKAALAAEHVSIVATDLGGNKGRMICFDCETGIVRVEIAGQLVNQL
jgi:chemotaxis protein CheD